MDGALRCPRAWIGWEAYLYRLWTQERTMNVVTPDGGDSVADRTWPGVLTPSCVASTSARTTPPGPWTAS